MFGSLWRTFWNISTMTSPRPACFPSCGGPCLRAFPEDVVFEDPILISILVHDGVRTVMRSNKCLASGQVGWHALVTAKPTQNEGLDVMYAVSLHARCPASHPVYKQSHVARPHE